MEGPGLWPIYHPRIPPVLRHLSATPPMARLRQVGMNCGCEYTDFPRFRYLAPYSRFRHSVGVGLIVWHFTHDAAQAAAGLLHDISTPVFAHVVDFLRGDHLTQTATEHGTAALIAASPEICRVLAAHGLTLEQVCDYHRYPVADNDAPRLSADRLEYTLGNAVNYGFLSMNRARALYRDLTVIPNEDGAPELAFRTRSAASAFTAAALNCARVYVADEDRFAMEALARLLRRALDNEDGETSHYASVAIMELRRKVQQQLAAAQTRWQRDPADPDAAAAWEQLLYRAATCDLYDAYSRRRYTARYRALSGRLLRDKKPRSRYLHHRVRLELQQGDLVKARQVCERYLALYPHSEQAVRDRLELYIQARDAAGLQGFLGTLPQRPVLLTTKTLDLVRAFRNEGSSEQDL